MPSQTPTPEQNNKKAWSFLKCFRSSNAPINLVAIHPVTGKTVGITRPVMDTAIYQFIEKYNGTSNLYFMVNTPFCNAPDKKLKKEHVEFINAVWLDADPAKGKPFDQERERLFTFADQLKEDENAPTYIVDSGGGIQAFWLLKIPVPATPENIILYEAYSRGLAEKHGTDNVQNVDRVMRIPYTWNIPTPKKTKRGRCKSDSKVHHAVSKEGKRYD